MGRARRSDRFTLDVTPRHLIFHPGVEEDLESIVAYYAERNPALPGRFRSRMKEQADRLLIFPESGAILFGSYRRVLLRRFPYMAVYIVSGEPIEVLALVNVRRDPAWIEATVAGRAAE